MPFEGLERGSLCVLVTAAGDNLDGRPSSQKKQRKQQLQPADSPRAAIATDDHKQNKYSVTLSPHALSAVLFLAARNIRTLHTCFPSNPLRDPSCLQFLLSTGGDEQNTAPTSWGASYSISFTKLINITFLLSTATETECVTEKLTSIMPPSSSELEDEELDPPPSPSSPL